MDIQIKNDKWIEYSFTHHVIHNIIHSLGYIDDIDDDCTSDDAITYGIYEDDICTEDANILRYKDESGCTHYVGDLTIII